MSTRRAINRVSLTLCFCAILAIGLPAWAQDSTGEVSGRVVSSRGNEPLALVQAQLEGTSLRAVTSNDGTFRITGVAAGQYTLQAAIVGYYTLHQEFSLGLGEIKTFEIVLTPSNARLTETVDVSADPFQVGLETNASEFTLE